MDNKKITSENYDEMKEKNYQKVNQDKKTKEKSKAQKAVPILVVAVAIERFSYYKQNKREIGEFIQSLQKALAKNNIPFEMHIYPYGGHGLSLATPGVGYNRPAIAQWFNDATRWIESIKIKAE